MNKFAAYVGLDSEGIAIIRDSLDIPTEDIALSSDKKAKAIFHLRSVYFSGKSATRKQAAAVTAAENNGHSIDTLIAIENVVKSLVYRKDVWALRLELVRMCGTTEAIAKHGRARVRALNPPKSPARGMRTRHGRDNTSTLTIIDDRNTISTLAKVLADHPNEPLDALLDLIYAGGVAEPKIRTMVRIPVDKSVAVTNGDEGVLFTLTDGSVLSGAQLAQKTLDEHGWAVLVHEELGPVDAHRTQRFANERQRVMISVDTQVCPWPGCNCAADDCEVHHVTDWAEGGGTNISNLMLLCPYHNGVNGYRGRMVKVGNVEAWAPPWGGPPQLNDHPVLALTRASFNTRA